MMHSDTNDESGETAVSLALAALTWTISEHDRADRFLSLTGLSAEGLRGRIDDPVMLAALLRFLEAHEPDLIACAEAIASEPETLVAARRRLEA